MKKETSADASVPYTENRFGKVIVMGASIAGLCAARALADHFEEVLLLERDHLPEGQEFRTGVPQVRQFHTLLLSGLQQMQTWFPGLHEELISSGAVPYDITGDTLFRIRNRWLPQFACGQVLLSCSRSLLESGIRRRLRQNPRVRILEGVEVVGLQAAQGNRRVSRVRSRSYRGASDKLEAVTVHEADFVIDALGRRSQTPEWLAELGYRAPQESEVDCFSVMSRVNTNARQTHR